MQTILSTIEILLAGSLWGTMGLFVRGLAADGYATTEITLLRAVGATILMALYLLLFDRKAFRIRLRDIWCFIGTGVVSLTFFNICYFTTIQGTSMAVAAILLYTSPIFVVLLSALIFREHMTWIKFLALVIAFCGVALVTGVAGQLLGTDAAQATSGIAPLTLLIGIGSGFGYALYSIFGRFALEKHYSSSTISFYTFLFSMIGLFVCTALFGGSGAQTPLFTPASETFGKLLASNTLHTLLLASGLSVFVTILPYLLYTKGLSGVETGKAGIMASIEPVVAAVLGMLVFGEQLSASGIIGMLLVLGAIVLLNLTSSQKTAE